MEKFGKMGVYAKRVLDMMTGCGNMRSGFGYTDVICNCHRVNKYEQD